MGWVHLKFQNIQAFRQRQDRRGVLTVSIAVVHESYLESGELESTVPVVVDAEKTFTPENSTEAT